MKLLTNFILFVGFFCVLRTPLVLSGIQLLTATTINVPLSGFASRWLSDHKMIAWVDVPSGVVVTEVNYTLRVSTSNTHSAFMGCFFIPYKYIWGGGGFATSLDVLQKPLPLDIISTGKPVPIPMCCSQVGTC